MLTDRPRARFNVFDVMRHGTHEKQLSNVFAWLLRADGTHGLGDAFQRVFIAEVDRKLRLQGEDVIADDSFGVRQEINTAAPGDREDIADIVLDGSQTTIVVENYYMSDGHGHSYQGYRKYGERQTTRSVVVLLCEHEIRSALIDDWIDAPVVLYATLLDALAAHVRQDDRYRRDNIEQFYFIENMHRHFTSRMALSMNRKSLVDFVDSLCQGGEAETFGQRQDVAARELGDRLREEAIQRFGEGRELLGRAKGILRDYCEATLREQVNNGMGANVLGDVFIQYAGIHVWSVSFKSHPEYRDTYGRDLLIHLELGPSAWHALNKGRWQAATFKPDYTRIVILEDQGGDRAVQSDVSLTEVIEGLAIGDCRLRDEIVGLIRSSS